MAASRVTTRPASSRAAAWYVMRSAAWSDVSMSASLKPMA